MARKLSNCQDCNKEITGGAIRCVKCNAVSKRKYPDMDRKTYRRNWQLKKKYGLDYGEFEAFWIVFQGICQICGKRMKRPTAGKGQDLDVVAVDHDHKTGEFRGLICNGCNKGLGFFKDNIELLRKATNYLKPRGAV